MKNLATPYETKEFGSLGVKFTTEEMMSQCKVMYDNIIINTEDVDEQDSHENMEELRLHRIKAELVQAMLIFDRIIDLNGN